MTRQTPTILIVDDDHEWREDITRKAREQFPTHHIVATSNLQTAEKAINENHVKGAIIDGSFFRYPTDEVTDSLCGIELAETLQKRKIPRVMFSGEDGLSKYGHRVRLTRTPFVSKLHPDGPEKAVSLLSRFIEQTAQAIEHLRG